MFGQRAIYAGELNENGLNRTLNVSQCIWIPFGVRKPSNSFMESFAGSGFPLPHNGDDLKTNAKIRISYFSPDSKVSYSICSPDILLWFDINSKWLLIWDEEVHLVLCLQFLHILKNNIKTQLPDSPHNWYQRKWWLITYDLQFLFVLLSGLCCSALDWAQLLAEIIKIISRWMEHVELHCRGRES